MAPAKLGLTTLAIAAVAIGGYLMAAPSCSTADYGPHPEGPGASEVPGATVPGDPVEGLPPEPERLEARQRVEINGRVFDMELALNDEQRYQGLSDRRSIAEDGGMLFVHPRARVLRFVMRRCHVPIDIAYLDENGTVVMMYAMEVIEPIGSALWYRPLRSYSSQKYALFALEFAGGTLETLGLEVGDTVDLPLEELKARAQ